MKKTAIKEILVDAKKLSKTKTEDELFEIIGYEVRIKELEAENAKLRECVEFYAVNGLSSVSVGTKVDVKLMHEFYIKGGFARQVLKELEEK